MTHTKLSMSTGWQLYSKLLVQVQLHLSHYPLRFLSFGGFELALFINRS